MRKKVRSAYTAPPLDCKTRMRFMKAPPQSPTCSHDSTSAYSSEKIPGVCITAIDVFEITNYQ